MPDYAELSREERRALYRVARRSPGIVAERIHYMFRGIRVDRR